jgi:hypothetical protein
LGRTVITKNIPLKARNVLRQGTNGKFEGTEEPVTAIKDLVCEPIWGPVPAWRMGFMYCAILFVPFSLSLLIILLALFFSSYAVKVGSRHFSKLPQ